MSNPVERVVGGICTTQRHSIFANNTQHMITIFRMVNHYPNNAEKHSWRTTNSKLDSFIMLLFATCEKTLRIGFEFVSAS